MRYVLLISVLAFGFVSQQDVIRLDSRVNQLEQRLYTMEASLRTIEQQSRLSGMNQRGSGVTLDDVGQLRSEIQALQVRLMEQECALARLDERTLTPTAREARRKAAGNDPCRLNSELPLRPPNR